MRTLMATAAILSLAVTGTAAEAGQHAPGVGGWHGPKAGPGGGYGTRPRWGGRVQGRWWGGMRAPGGWSAYRRPMRGWVLPSYWIAPGWYVRDWTGYGLPTPPAGYNWSRYYDDAVLIDGRGSVYDTIGGVDWDRDDPADADYAYRDEPPVAPPPAGAGYPVPGAMPPPPPPAPHDSGLGGAAVGAAVGGVAGNVIAGRGNRLGGTLIGAGVGAAAGYAIDKAEDRGRRGPRRRYGADYPAPDSRYRPLPPPPPAPPPIVTAGPGATIVSTGTQPTPGYYAGGYYYPGTSITTVTIQPKPGVTTTEVWESAPRRTWRPKRAWRPAQRCKCK